MDTKKYIYLIHKSDILIFNSKYNLIIWNSQYTGEKKYR